MIQTISCQLILNALENPEYNPEINQALCEGCIFIKTGDKYEKEQKK